MQSGDGVAAVGTPVAVPRAAPWRLKILAALLGSLLALTAVEGGLRGWTALAGDVPFASSVDTAPYLRRDLLLEFRLRPNFRGPNVRINSHGFRGPEFTPEPAAGTRRVVALGDSCTFGTYTRVPGLPGRYAFRAGDEAASYPAILASVLAADRRGDGYEVINAGVPGYSTAQALRWLETEIFGYRPEVLVVYLGWNDLNNALHPGWTEARGAYGGWRARLAETSGGRTMVWLVRSSAALETLYHAQLALRRPGNAAAAPGPRVGPAARVSGEGAVRLFRENLALLARRGAARGVRTVLVTLPTVMTETLDADARRAFDVLARWGDGSPLWAMHRKANEAIRQVARTEGATLVDLAALFGAPESPEWFTDDVHPNAEGAARVAHAVAQAIRQARAERSVR